MCLITSKAFQFPHTVIMVLLWLFALVLTCVHAQVINSFNAFPSCYAETSPPHGIALTIVKLDPVSLYNYTATIRYNYEGDDDKYVSLITASSKNTKAVCESEDECREINGKTFTLDINVVIDSNDPYNGVLRGHTGVIVYEFTIDGWTYFYEVDCEYYAVWAFMALYSSQATTTTTTTETTTSETTTETETTTTTTTETSTKITETTATSETVFSSSSQVISTETASSVSSHVLSSIAEKTSFLTSSTSALSTRLSSAQLTSAISTIPASAPSSSTTPTSICPCKSTQTLAPVITTVTRQRTSLCPCVTITGSQASLCACKSQSLETITLTLPVPVSASTASGSIGSGSIGSGSTGSGSPGSPGSLRSASPVQGICPCLNQGSSTEESGQPIVEIGGSPISRKIMPAVLVTFLGLNACFFLV